LFVFELIYILFFYGSGTFESGLIAKCNQKKVLNQYLPFPQTEQAVNRDVNYLLFQGGSYYEAG